MRILILTPTRLSAHTGPLARLNIELEFLARNDTIEILCLGKEPDDESTKEEFSNVHFNHLPIEFNGWEVKNISALVKEIDRRALHFRADLIILQMEIWDLMRELSSIFKIRRIPFATILHAMPFLGAPTKFGLDFKSDVQAYLDTDLQSYRKTYILQHFTEAEGVFKKGIVIANNKTVEASFQFYFPDIKIYLQSRSMASSMKKVFQMKQMPSYDFVYMARMEPGKGIEYFSSILPCIAKHLGRSVKLAILGKVDDPGTGLLLQQLIQESEKTSEYSVEFLGWADERMKRLILTDSGVFLYPSHYDNFPTVVNEALSFALPCVTWDLPFSQLNYADSLAIFRAQFLNVEAFAVAAASALRDRERLRSEALQYVKTFDTPSQVAQRDRELFSHLAEGSYGIYA